MTRTASACTIRSPASSSGRRSLRRTTTKRVYRSFERGDRRIAGSVGQGPADHGHGEDQQEHSGADDAQGSTVAQQVVAGFGINAENNGDNRYHAPGQQDGHALVPADHSEELRGWLACGNPPGKQRSYASGQRERQKFAREPALDLRPGLFPDKIVPSEQGGG